MWKLRERLKDQKGFTLVEMLIVVAIIAILIAVSIPMVSGTLEKAREAVDDANFRDAAALGSIEYLQDPDNAAGTYWYVVNDAQQGRIESAPATSDIYTSQCTCASGNHGKTGTSADKNIKVVVAADGNVTVLWEKKS